MGYRVDLRQDDARDPSSERSALVVLALLASTPAESPQAADALRRAARTVPRFASLSNSTSAPDRARLALRRFRGRRSRLGVPKARAVARAAVESAVPEGPDRSTAPGDRAAPGCRRSAARPAASAATADPAVPRAVFPASLQGLPVDRNSKLSRHVTARERGS